MSGQQSDKTTEERAKEFEEWQKVVTTEEIISSRGRSFPAGTEVTITQIGGNGKVQIRLYDDPDCYLRDIHKVVPISSIEPIPEE